MTQKKLEGLRILVVEDEQFLRETIVEEFQYCGAIVEEASGGNQAFELYKKMEFDIVFTDIRMPDGNGFEFIKNINAFKSKNIPKIFVCTGFSEYSDDEFFNLKVLKIFKKPFDFDEIIQCLHD